MIALEKIIEILRDQRIDWRYVEEEKLAHFRNEIVFSTKYGNYYISWYANVCTLTMGAQNSSYIEFTEMKPNNTWPAYINGLEFWKESESSFYITLKKLEWQR